MWRVFQLTLFVGTLFANIHFQWTPNGYVAAALGVLAALLGTAVINWTMALAVLLRRYQGVDRGGSAGVKPVKHPGRKLVR
jgi:xanthosine utilization system XapX-like protein